MGDRLNASEIQKNLCEKISKIEVFENIDSTNSYGKGYILSGNPLPALVLSEEQTAGRGRCDRSFYSPKESGLYTSILYSQNSKPEDALFATITASVASALAIEELSDKSVQIKWVNDIYIDGKKAGGILCESVFFDGQMGVVVGIGINVSTKKFPEFENNTPTSTGNLDRNALAAKIYDYFVKFSKDKSYCLEEYKKRFFLLNKAISIHRPNGVIDSATARGIDELGGLIVEHENGKAEIIRTGEVTVRLK